MTRNTDIKTPIATTEIEVINDYFLEVLTKAERGGCFSKNLLRQENFPYADFYYGAGTLKELYGYVFTRPLYSGSTSYLILTHREFRIYQIPNPPAPNMMSELLKLEYQYRNVPQEIQEIPEDLLLESDIEMNQGFLPMDAIIARRFHQIAGEMAHIAYRYPKETSISLPHITCEMINVCLIESIYDIPQLSLEKRRALANNLPLVGTGEF